MSVFKDALDHPVVSILALVAFGVGLAGAIAAAIGPCHEGHRKVSYVAEHHIVHSSGKTEWTQYIPEHCYEDWTCDLRCKAADEGRLEGHGKHKAIELDLVIDHRCEASDGGWSVKP